MKSFNTALILFGGLFLYLSAVVSAGNVTWGSQGPQDRLLARDVVKKAAPWFTKNTVTVAFPPKNQPSLGTISAIHVQDLGGHDNWATANLVEGGPKTTTATVVVKSQKRKPIDMIIEFYGQ